MAKEFQARLTQTITFIRDNTPFPGSFAEKDVVINALNDWNANETLVNRQALSAVLSQENTPNRPSSKPKRKIRRAAALLNCLIVKDDSTQWQARADAIYNSGSSKDPAIGYFRTYFEQAYDAVMGFQIQATAAIDLLKADPTTFLQRYKINLAGVNVAGRTTYRVRMERGVYKLDPTRAGQGAYSFDAINIPTTPYVSVQNTPGQLPGVDSTNHGGLDLILTTQLTACTYCFSVAPGSIVIAHIWPQGKGAQVGDTIATAMRQHGAFQNGNGGTFKAFGPESGGHTGYPGGYTNMVAVRRQGNWEVYAQMRDTQDAITVTRLDTLNFV